MANNITPERCRQVATDCLDRLLGHRWLAGLSNEQYAVASAARSVVVTNDDVVAKVAAAVGPYQATTAAAGQLETVEGEVTGVGFSPGRRDGRLLITLDRERLADLDLLDVDTDLSVDGFPVDSEAFLTHLLLFCCRAKLWPLPGRYGLALKAELTTIKEPAA